MRTTLLARYDIRLAGVVAALLIVGLPMVFSASHLLGFQESGQATYYLELQIRWVLVGLAAMVVFSVIPYHFWRRLSPLAIAVNVVLLVYVLFRGAETFGAQRTLADGSFQPSEIAKLVNAMYVAYWLSTLKWKLQDFWYSLVPLGLIISVVAGLVFLEPDLSTAVILVISTLTMFWTAGAPKRQIIAAGALLVVLMAIGLIAFPYRWVRFLRFTHPLDDPTGDGYQIYRMLLAMGNGGLFGHGFGSLPDTVGIVPASHTDAIFAVIGNDFGFIGCALVVFLFMALTQRGLRIAEQATDMFGSLLATGITMWLASQALMNIASAASSIPFTGVPLPFISYGGSAMIANLAGVGVLLNIARSSSGMKSKPRLAPSGRAAS